MDHIRDIGPWYVLGLILISLLRSSLTPTPDGPVEDMEKHQAFNGTHLKQPIRQMIIIVRSCMDKITLHEEDHTNEHNETGGIVYVALVVDHLFIKGG